MYIMLYILPKVEHLLNGDYYHELNSYYNMFLLLN